ncbi:MAG: zinc transporter ZntB [Pseudomonadota bacterium]|nr:zinc transporter ZntB [Pseudomonadota bacterium]
MSNHILYSYGFNAKGNVQALSAETIANEIESKNFAWVHLDNSHEKTMNWLRQELDFLDTVVLDALTEESTRPRCEVIGKGVLLILRGANLNKDAKPEDMVSLRIWADEERLITLQRRSLKAVMDFEKKLLNGQIEGNAGACLAHLVSLLTQRMEPELNRVGEILDELEEQVLEDPAHVLSEQVVDVRKKSILFKKFLLPQQGALDECLETDLNWLNDKSLRLLSESYNRTCRYIEGLDAVRERAQVVRDELASALTEKLNKNMYLLSIVTAIFLPLGFLTGLLGVNVGGMPGAENPHAFYYFCVILVVLVLIQMVMFVKLKWF